MTTHYLILKVAGVPKQRQLLICPTISSLSWVKRVSPLYLSAVHLSSWLQQYFSSAPRALHQCLLQLRPLLDIFSFNPTFPFTFSNPAECWRDVVIQPAAMIMYNFQAVEGSEKGCCRQKFPTDFVRKMFYIRSMAVTICTYAIKKIISSSVPLFPLESEVSSIRLFILWIQKIYWRNRKPLNIYICLFSYYLWAALTLPENRVS